MRARRVICGLWLAAALVACAQPSTPTPTPAAATPTLPLFTPPAPTPTSLAVTLPAASATPLPTPAEPAKVSLAAPDGAQLAAAFYPPVVAPAPGVLLLHMLGGSRADWDSFARGLQARGMAALALDLRGHGQSAQPEDWSKGPGDVRAAWDYLVARPEVDAADSAIVGASIGANLALIVGANNPSVVTVIALSPGTDYHDLKPTGLLSNFGQRPVLLVASQDDAYAYHSAQQMVTLAPAGDTHYFARAGHGTHMFADAALEPLLVEWLLKHLGILKG